SVLFGEVAAASFTVYSDTLLTAVAPADPAATFDMSVTTPAGTSARVSADRFAFSAASAPAVSSLSVNDQFTYTATAAPTVSSISPTSGSTAGGTVVKITGTNLNGASAVKGHVTIVLPKKEDAEKPSVEFLHRIGLTEGVRID